MAKLIKLPLLLFFFIPFSIFAARTPPLTDEDISLISHFVTNLPNHIFLETKDEISSNLLSRCLELTGKTDLEYEEFYEIRQEFFSALSQLRFLKKLRLIALPFEKFPVEIFNLIELNHLTLSNNNLQQLPARIGILTKMTELVITQNKITHIPDEIGNLRRLTLLSFNENNIRYLPETIGNFRPLRFLCLNMNQLSSLPHTVENLWNLRSLSIEGNQIQQLPIEICNLRKLKNILGTENCWVSESNETNYGLVKLQERFGERLIYQNSTVTLQK